MKIEAARFSVNSQRIVVECISGRDAANARPGFVKLLDRLKSGDILMVTKLDRLGCCHFQKTTAQNIRSGVREASRCDNSDLDEKFLSIGPPADMS
ncbi:hypothetical protein GH769_07150 [Pseudomonas sp. CFSAN084952]|nr:hypothetical protein GH769_07150 [Pseudomonas sp. CFSAN084952]